MIQKIVLPVVFLGIIFLSASRENGLEIYVSPDGNDAAIGTRSAPVQSLHRAAQLLEESAGQRTVRVYLSGGSYPLAAPLVLGPEHGGTAEAPVLWKALPGENVVISGGIPLDGWKEEMDGSWSAPLPPGCNDKFRALYINGRPAVRSRHPNEGYLRVNKAGEDLRTHFYFKKDDIPGVDPFGDIELVFLHDWSITRIPVKSIDQERRRLTAIDSIGSRLPFFTMTHWEEQARYYLENAREFCDHPGEWFADFQARKIYYRPLAGEKIEETEGIIPLTEKLLLIEGSETTHTGHIRFEGITFEHSAWSLPEKGYCGIQACMFTDRSSHRTDWSKVPAAIELNHAKACSFHQCTLRNTGGSGIWIRRNCRECEISESHIYNVSGNGIGIGEGNDRLADGRPWWKSRPEEVASGNKISRCLIERCGTQFHGAVGIWCGLVAGTVIEYNEIRDLPYSGVSIGWMWTSEPTPCRENTVHANHIHHILTILSDGGGIYSLGLQPGSRLSQNLIHDVQVNAGRAESNGMFLDEGTRELVIENNIVYHIARSPLRFHKAQDPNWVRDNVLVCNEQTQAIRYNNTKKASIKKSGNIILQQNSEADMSRLEELIRERIPD